MIVSPWRRQSKQSSHNLISCNSTGPRTTQQDGVQGIIIQFEGKIYSKESWKGVCHKANAEKCVFPQVDTLKQKCQ